VDSSERSNDDGGSSKESRLKSGVLSRRSLSVVLISDDDPRNSVLSVVGSDGGDRSELSGDLVLDRVGLSVGLVDG